MQSIPPYPGLVIETQQRVWNGRFPLDLIGFRHQRFDGEQSGLRQWELWRRGRAAALLPYDPQTDQVVLIEQFRLPALAAGVDPVMAEIPAGLLDADESIHDTALRETQEETGLRPDRVERIGEFVLTPGGSDECCTIFVGRVQAPVPGADGLAGVAGLATENEDIRIRVLAAQDAIDNALAGMYPNSVISLALLWLAARRDWLRSEWTVQ